MNAYIIIHTLLTAFQLCAFTAFNRLSHVWNQTITPAFLKKYLRKIVNQLVGSMSGLWSHEGVRLIPDYNQEVKDRQLQRGGKHSLVPRCCWRASSGNCTLPLRKLCNSCPPLASVRPGCKQLISCRSRNLKMEKKGTRSAGGRFPWRIKASRAQQPREWSQCAERV